MAPRRHDSQHRRARGSRRAAGELPRDSRRSSCEASPIATPTSRVPAAIIAVVKANAYGHGSQRVALALEQAGATMLACADIEEGIVLRRGGVRVPILVFGALSVSDLDGLFEFSLTPTISTPSAARAVQAAAASGTRSIALSPEDRHRDEPARVPPRQPAAHAAGAARRARTCGSTRSTRISRRPTIPTARSSTSSACGSSGAGDGRRARRHAAVCATRRTAPRCCATRASGTTSCARAAALRHRPAAARVDDSASAGHVAHEPRGRRQRPAARRRRSATAGGSRPTRPRTIAVVPAGYADGLDTRLGGRGQVLIRGRRVPIVGAVSMDMMTVDVTGSRRRATGRRGRASSAAGRRELAADRRPRDGGGHRDDSVGNRLPPRHADRDDNYTADSDHVRRSSHAMT